MDNEDLFIRFGFLLPPKGEAVDLSERLPNYRHYDYCKQFITLKASPGIQKAFSIYKKRTEIEIPQLDITGIYTDFCIRVLGWCKVGNHWDLKRKIITCSFTMDWQEKICEEYESYGFFIDAIPGIGLSSLLE